MLQTGRARTKVIVEHNMPLKKSETRMTASVLKQDPNTRKVHKNAICWDKTEPANF